MTACRRGVISLLEGKGSLHLSRWSAGWGIICYIQDLRSKGWVVDGESPCKKLLIDALGNIHHCLCYREFNSQREWEAHDLDRLRNDALTLTFDSTAWEKAIAYIPRLPTVDAGSASGTAFLGELSGEKPYCIFHPPSIH